MFVFIGMKLRWIYLGLVMAVAVAALVLQQLGSNEVASHAFGHVVFAAGILAVMWLIKRPVSSPNRWLWRGGWLISTGQWVEALGAFGYDDAATSAVPGLRSVHNLVAPLVVFPALMILLGSAMVLVWTRLPRPAAVVFVGLGSAAGLFLIATAIGIGP